MSAVCLLAELWNGLLMGGVAVSSSLMTLRSRGMYVIEVHGGVKTLTRALQDELDYD